MSECARSASLSTLPWTVLPEATATVSSAGRPSVMRHVTAQGHVVELEDDIGPLGVGQLADASDTRHHAGDVADGVDPGIVPSHPRQLSRRSTGGQRKLLVAGEDERTTCLTSPSVENMGPFLSPQVEGTPLTWGNIEQRG